MHLGVMVEVPSAALMAGELARRVDFLSIGTNDLTQYTLAADRGNAALADLQDALHPAVLRLVRMALEGAAAAGIPVAVCGELAGDPAGALVLVGMGVDELSADPASLTADPLDACLGAHAGPAGAGRRGPPRAGSADRAAARRGAPLGLTGRRARNTGDDPGERPGPSWDRCGGPARPAPVQAWPAVGAPPLSAARRASTSTSSMPSSRLANCASSDEAATSSIPRAWASWRRIFSSYRDISLVGSVIETLFTASWTCVCASASLARATSSSRFCTSSSRLARIALRPSLSLLDELGLRVDLGLEGLDLVLEADLPLERDLGQRRRTCRRPPAWPAARSSSARLRRRGGLVAPLDDGLAGLLEVVLEQAEVPDRLRDRLLGLTDVVRVVAEHLVEHLLGVLGAVEQRVDVGAHQLRDAAEDRLLCHRHTPSGCVWRIAIVTPEVPPALGSVIVRGRRTVARGLHHPSPLATGGRPLRYARPPLTNGLRSPAASAPVPAARRRAPATAPAATPRRPAETAAASTATPGQHPADRGAR